MDQPDLAWNRRIVGTVGATLIASIVASFVAGDVGWAFGFAVLLVGFIALAALDFASMRLGGSGFGFEATKAAAQAEVEIALAEADVDDVVDHAQDNQLTQPVGERPKVDAAFIKRLIESRKEREQRRRGALERVMTEAAEWGFTLARSGYTSPVRVKVDWDSGPAPRLMFDEHPRPSSFFRARLPVAGEGPANASEALARQLAIARLRREDDEGGEG